jgi:hypothetical protein
MSRTDVFWPHISATGSLPQVSLSQDPLVIVARPLDNEYLHQTYLQKAVLKAGKLYSQNALFTSDMGQIHRAAA